MIKYEGYWNSVRKTIYRVMVDEKINCFDARFLVDSGAICSLILLFTLFKSKGVWDIGPSPTIGLTGINSSSSMDLICNFTFIPGAHITKDFRACMRQRPDFNVRFNMHIQYNVEVFKTKRRILPDFIIEPLSNTDYYCLADPAQIQKSEDPLYIHGIIGEHMIPLLDETHIIKITNNEISLTRGQFGDVIHGRSHFVIYPWQESELKIKEDGEIDAAEQDL